MFDSMFDWTEYVDIMFTEPNSTIADIAARLHYEKVNNMDKNMDWTAEQEYLDSEPRNVEIVRVLGKEVLDMKDMCDKTVEEMTVEERDMYDQIPMHRERWMRYEIEEVDEAELEEYGAAFFETKLPMDVADERYWRSTMHDDRCAVEEEQKKPEGAPVQGILRIETEEVMFRSDYDDRVWPDMQHNPHAQYYIGANKRISRDWYLQAQTDEPCKGARYVLVHPRYKRTEGGRLIEDTMSTIYKGYIINGKYKEEVVVRAYEGHDKYKMKIGNSVFNVVSVFWYAPAGKYIIDSRNKQIEGIKTQMQRNKEHYKKNLINKEGDSAEGQIVGFTPTSSVLVDNYELHREEDAIAECNAIALEYRMRANRNKQFDRLVKQHEQLRHRLDALQRRLDSGASIRNVDKSINYLETTIANLEQEIAALEV